MDEWHAYFLNSNITKSGSQARHHGLNKLELCLLKSGTSLLSFSYIKRSGRRVTVLAAFSVHSREKSSFNSNSKQKLMLPNLYFLCSLFQMTRIDNNGFDMLRLLTSQKKPKRRRQQKGTRKVSIIYLPCVLVQENKFLVIHYSHPCSTFTTK